MRISLMALLCFGSIVCQVALAGQLEGIVKNKDSGELLSGIEVLADGKSIALTDANGVFKFKSGTIDKLSIDHPDYMYFESDFKPGMDKILINLKKRETSAATLRWKKYMQARSPKLDFTPQKGWNVTFKESELKGDFAPDPAVTRRDPSAVIKIKDTYYVWYSRGTGDVPGFDTGDPEAKVFPWDKCDVYYATSKDGIEWKEQGPAVLRGMPSEYDDRSVFTPEVFAHKGKYYLVYQAVKAPYTKRVKNTVGMSWSNSPDGPWNRLKEPILRATNNGIWKGEGDDYKSVIKKGDFDSHKVHDPTLLYFKDKYYLYYKGERMGEERYFGQREIKWGVAIADNVFGPYEKHPANPLTNTGHELVIWKFNGGIALINTLDGPERGTVQFAQDGIHFEIMGRAKKLPKAQGLFRAAESFDDPLQGVRWGLSHILKPRREGWWMYINRFEVAE